jgi:hypothetical protein
MGQRFSKRRRTIKKKSNIIPVNLKSIILNDMNVLERELNDFREELRSMDKTRKNKADTLEDDNG